MDGAASGPSQSQLSPDALNEMAQLAGQSGSVPTAPTGAGAGNLPTTLPQPDQSRAVGSIKEELVERPLEDLKTELTAIFSLHKLLGITNPSDTPEQQAKKAQLLQRFNQMTQEEQAVAQQHYQELMMRKRQQEEEDLMKKQRAEAAQAESFAVPTGPQRGPADSSGQSKAQAAMQKLKQDRTTMSSNLQSAG